MVLVKPSDKEEELGGLVLPDTVKKERANTGTVVKVGPKVKDIKAKDKIVFNPYSGEKIETEGKDYWLVDEKDIYATM